MLDAGHGMALDALTQRRPHLAQMIGVLAIGLLRPAQGRMPQQVDADAPEERTAPHPQFPPDQLAGRGLERGAKARASRHADRETGGGAKPDAARPVDKLEPRNAKTGNDGGRAGAVALPQGQRADAPLPEFDVAIQRGQPFLGRKRRAKRARNMV